MLTISDLSSSQSFFFWANKRHMQPVSPKRHRFFFISPDTFQGHRWRQTFPESTCGSSCTFGSWKLVSDTKNGGFFSIAVGWIYIANWVIICYLYHLSKEPGNSIDFFLTHTKGTISKKEIFIFFSQDFRGRAVSFGWSGFAGKMLGGHF